VSSAVVKQASLAHELEALIGRAHVSEADREAFAVGGAIPHAIARPGSYEDVAAILRHADERRLAVIPWGGGTMMRLGNAPARYDIALSLARLNNIVEHEPADLTVTCQAGITLGALRERLAATGQSVPLDPSLPAEATVGGALAANAWGAYRLAYGTPRDFTIGMRVVTADGRITRAGGKVVKNVAGYDLCKLYIGSLGTLGVIVEATFKVRPLPRAERHLAFDCDSPESACAAANEAYRRGLSLSAATVSHQGEGRWLLGVHLEGMPAAVERSARELEALAGTPVATAGPAKEEAVALRLSTLPSALPSLLSRLATLTGVRLAAYPTAGVVRLAADDDALVEPALVIAEDAGATALIESCPPPLKAGRDVFGEAPDSLPLMRSLKRQFDPHGTLGPGRFAGGI